MNLTKSISFRIILSLILIGVRNLSYSQFNHSRTDSILQKYQIPELAYAVVTSDEILEMDVVGVQRYKSNYKASLNDKFRIGSNTKAITGYLAARLVKDKKLRWDTEFFDLFPELKPGSLKAYHHMTLLNLLSFRTRLFPYTYTNEIPTEHQFHGDETQQRYEFAQWFLKQKPAAKNGKLHFSNLGYVAAGMMLEKASGKSYKELVAELGHELGIQFYFGSPNSIDTLQPWGHDSSSHPQPPGDSYKLNWLLAAGNITMSLPDYCTYIQSQLKGLQGKSSFLSQEEFRFVFEGLPGFSLGWFWAKDDEDHVYTYNVGNPGTFLSKVFVYEDQNIAFIFLTNAQTELCNDGLNDFFMQLKMKYIR